MRTLKGMPLPVGHQAMRFYRNSQLLASIVRNEKRGLRLPGPGKGTAVAKQSKAQPSPVKEVKKSKQPAEAVVVDVKVNKKTENNTKSLSKKAVLTSPESSVSSLPSLSSHGSEDLTLDQLMDTITLSELAVSVTSCKNVSKKMLKTVSTPFRESVSVSTSNTTTEPLQFEIISNSNESVKEDYQLPTIEEVMKAADQNTLIENLNIQLEIVNAENVVLQNERSTHSNRLLELLDMQKKLMDSNMKVAEMEATIQFLEENPMPAEVPSEPRQCSNCDHQQEVAGNLENEIRKLKNATSKYEQVIQEERTANQNIRKELEEVQRTQNEEARLSTGRLSHSDRDKIFNAENETRVLEYKLSESQKKLRFAEEQREGLIKEQKELRQKMDADSITHNNVTYKHSQEIISLRTSHSDELSKYDSQIQNLKVEAIALRERAQVAERTIASPQRGSENQIIEIESLQSQLKSVSNNNELLQNKLTDLQSHSYNQIKSLQSDNRIVSTELTNTKEKLQQLQQQNSSAAQIELELAALKNQFSEQEAANQISLTEITILKSTCLEKDSENSKLRTQLQSSGKLRSEIEVLKNRFLEQESANLLSGAEIETLKTLSVKKEQEALVTREELEKYQNNTQSELQTLKKSLQEETEKCKQFKSEITTIEKQLDERNQELEKAPTPTQLEQATEALLKLEYDRRDLQRQLEGKSFQCSEIQNELNRITESRNEVQTLKGQLEIENQSLKKTLNSFKAHSTTPSDQELKKVVREKHELTTNLNAVKASHSGMEAELSREMLQKSDLENRLTSLNRKYLSMKSDCEGATRKASVMKTDLDAAHRRLMSLEGDNKRIHNMQAPSTPSAKNESDALAMNRKLRATLDTANRRIVSLEATSKEHESFRNTLNSEITALKSKQSDPPAAAALRREIDQLKATLQAAQHRIITINKENSEYRDEVKQDLATRLNTQTNKIHSLQAQITELEKVNGSERDNALVKQLDEIRLEHGRQSSTMNLVRNENERLKREIDAQGIENEKISQELRTLKIRSELNEKYEEQLLARLANLEKERAEYAASKAVLRTSLSQSQHQHQENNILSLESEVDVPLRLKIKRQSSTVTDDDHYDKNSLGSPVDQFSPGIIKRRRSSITASTPSQQPLVSSQHVQEELQNLRPTTWSVDDERMLIGILKRRLKTAMSTDAMSELFEYASKQLDKDPDVIEKHFWANKETIIAIANIPGPSPRRPSNPFTEEEDEQFRHVKQLLATVDSDDEESTNLAQEVLSELTGRSNTAVVKRLDSFNTRLTQSRLSQN